MESRFKWKRYAHACGIAGWYAPIGRERAQRIARAAGLSRLPRIGYCVDVHITLATPDDREPRTYLVQLSNRGCRYEIQPFATEAEALADAREGAGGDDNSEDDTNA